MNKYSCLSCSNNIQHCFNLHTIRYDRKSTTNTSIYSIYILKLYRNTLVYFIIIMENVGFNINNLNTHIIIIYMMSVCTFLMQSYKYKGLYHFQFKVKNAAELKKKYSKSIFNSKSKSEDSIEGECTAKIALSEMDEHISCTACNHARA